MRRMTMYFMFGVLFCINVTIFAQEVPSDYVGTWHSSQGGASQIITFFEDGQFILYRNSRSEVIASPTREQSIIIAHGNASFTQTQVTFSPVEAVSIEKPGCEDSENSFVQPLHNEPFTSPIAYDGFLALTINGAPHYSYGIQNKTGFMLVPLTADKVTRELVGEWEIFSASGDMGMVGNLTIGTDGTFHQNIALSSTLCSSYRDYSGAITEINRLTAVFNIAAGQTTVSCSSSDLYPMRTSREIRTWWLGYSPAEGYILSLDGSEYTRVDGTNTSPPRQSSSAIPTATASSPISERNLFTDDFASNDADWETGGGLDFFSGFENGAYVMRFNPTSIIEGWLVAPGFTDWSLAPQFSQQVGVVVNVEGTCTNNLCGIGIAFNVERDYTNALMFTYFPSGGQWALLQFNSDEVLADGLATDNIDLFDGQSHNLLLLVDEGVASLGIDGKLIGTAYGDWTVDGTVGLYLTRDISTAVDVKFSLLIASD